MEDTVLRTAESDYRGRRTFRRTPTPVRPRQKTGVTEEVVTEGVWGDGEGEKKY